MGFGLERLTQMSKKWQWKEHTRQEWIDLHNSPDFITASEVATILGQNKWESPYSLYHRKKGLLPRVVSTRKMRKGHALEDFIAEEYEMETGRVVINPGQYTMASHPNMPWFMATLDRYDDENRAVELKTTGFRAKEEWEDGGPVAYQIQNQAQLLCASLDKGSLVGLVESWPDDELYVHDFERHDRICNVIEKVAIEFYERLQNNDPPDVDETESTAMTLKALHPKDNGESVYCDDAAPWIEERWQLKNTMKHMKRDLNLVENKLKDAIGDATELWADGHCMTYKWQNRKEHMVKASEFRKLHFK